MTQLELSSLASLKELRASCLKPSCPGLGDSVIEAFLASDPLLTLALQQAERNLTRVKTEYPEEFKKSEEELLTELPSQFLSFYPSETASPYVPLAAKGPWIITAGGAVIYDTGGYGMLGQGHDPDCVRNAMSEPQVMANIMTPSFVQSSFTKKLSAQIRSGSSCPFDKFLCMNSGSEAMAVALRISDARAKKMTDPGAPHEGQEVKILSFSGSFHGRTARPALISDSTRTKYLELASFRPIVEKHTTLPINDLKKTRKIIQDLKKKNFFIEAIVFEPVMGEGRPGTAIEREYYDLLRELANELDALLISDAIQAGLRAQGVLSIVDYPGFEDCIAPDMEVYSKALNAGQYPLSVLAMAPGISDHYLTGTYGNTMTANPRALAVGCRVLDGISSSLTENIRSKGTEFKEKLEALRAELPEIITEVSGTGLLIAAELNPDKIPVVGDDGAEQRLRKLGVNVIHGGKNALRFTPWFLISSAEIDLICSKTKEVLENY